MAYKPDKKQIEMLRGELTKVRCWMTGFGAARNHPSSPISHAGIPGEDSLRQTIQLLDEILKS